MNDHCTTETSEACKELKREMIERLWRENVPTAQIVELTGCTRNAIYATVSALRRSGVSLPRRQGSEPVIAMSLRPDLLAAASTEAARRGVTLQELASRILIAVIADRMVNAVLDDTEAT